MFYSIKSPGNPPTSQYARTWNDARYLFQVACYETLAAFGKLDTGAAYQVMAQARARTFAPFMVGQYADLVVSNTGRTVTLERVN